MATKKVKTESKMMAETRKWRKAAYEHIMRLTDDELKALNERYAKRMAQARARSRSRSPLAAIRARKGKAA